VKCLQLYLDGIIERFWYTQDRQGVALLMNVASLSAAEAVTEKLPLVSDGFVKREFLPVGPAEISIAAQVTPAKGLAADGLG